MKLLKTLCIGLMAVACAGTASATPTILHVVGSTAFRAGTTIAVVDYLAGTTVANNTSGTGYEYTVTPGSTTVYGASSTTNMSSAGMDIFANGTIGGSGTATVIVELSWTGSLAGVVDLTAQTSTAAFFDETNTNVINAVNAQVIPTTGSSAYATPGTALATSGNTKTVSDIEMAMSDSVKTTIAKELGTGATFASGYSSVGSYTSISSLATACGGSTITDAGTVAPGTVAIVPFQWIVGNMSGVNGTTGSTTPYGDSSTYTIPTNINQEQARQLVGSGAVPQAFFTGGTTDADFGNWFLFLGRNEDSGTRIGYLMESQFGVTANPFQWTPSFTNAAHTTAYPITPLNTEPAIVWNRLGHSGFSSGGNISGPLSTANTGNVYMDPTYTPSSDYANGYFISSLGITDAYTAGNTSSHGTPLTYNGVGYSPANVQSGAYSMWEYEHCYRLSGATTAVKNAVNTIADIITASDADIFYGSTGSGFVTHSENESTGVYTPGSNDTAGIPQWPVGVKNDEFVQVSRSATEGGPISTLY